MKNGERPWNSCSDTTLLTADASAPVQPTELPIRSTSVGRIQPRSYHIWEARNAELSHNFIRRSLKEESSKERFRDIEQTHRQRKVNHDQQCKWSRWWDHWFILVHNEEATSLCQVTQISCLSKSNAGYKLWWLSVLFYVKTHKLGRHLEVLPARKALGSLSWTSFC